MDVLAMMIVHPAGAFFASATSTQAEVFNVLAQSAIFLELRLDVVISGVEANA
jgi:hypothetical protein